ncbi:MAG TPA: Zn-ribbon domain-containing OB-fold protein [Candidatus Bathyarchaeia archaeon]|nr:Zn-ribbon domain-containing OB-fold protein [Candidatus Bathyarchaeia archaeon]
MGNTEIEKINRPETVKLPFMLDFYPLEDAKTTEISQFFQNLKQGKLTTTKCKKCSQLLWPPRIVCPNCLASEFEWADLGTEGELYAFTEVRIGAPLGFVQDAPFCVGLVKIGGLTISSRIDNAKHDQLKIGDKLQLKIVELADGRIFFRFAKA